MRKRADWMVRADDLILELLEEEGQYTPTIIAEKTDYSTKHVNRRCIVLQKFGLLRNIRRGLYQITDEGRAYLEGDLDANELERAGGDNG
jgi:DNA-binding IclR family transcriptional regulator